MEVEERSFTAEEAQGADEAFVTSASAFVMPVVEIDGVKLGGGTPGRVADTAEGNLSGRKPQIGRLISVPHPSRQRMATVPTSVWHRTCKS